MLAQPETYVYVAGLEQLRDELDKVFSSVAGSEEAWKRRKTELSAGHRCVEAPCSAGCEPALRRNRAAPVSRAFPSAVS